MDGTTNSAALYMHTLNTELTQNTFRDPVIAADLVKLKVLARSPRLAPAVYCEAGIDVLAKAAFDKDSTNRPTSSLEAARILANALLLQDRWQQYFAGQGYVTGVLNFYRRPGVDYEFVGGRILFLLTYKSQIDFVSLIESQGLIDAIDSHLSRHASQASTSYFNSNPMVVPALVESLKLLYNLASKHQSQMHFFSPSVTSIMKILTTSPIPAKPLDPPIAQLLNVLAVIDWPSSLFNQGNKQMLELTKFSIKLLEGRVPASSTADLELSMVPLLIILRKVAEVENEESRTMLKRHLLPQDDERDKPLGQSDTLASRLLRLQAAAGTTFLPEAIAGLLFELSGRDARTFVHNVGYGHAAGYLMNHKIAIPQDVGTDISSHSAKDGQVNPITGQRRDTETPVELPEMTDAEKEREAERLFVLFERLKATGVVNVENPLEAAQRSGKLQEISDNDTD